MHVVACGCFATCVMLPLRYSLDQNNMELPVLHSLDHCECSSTPALSFASATIAVAPSNGQRGRPSGPMRTQRKHSAAQPVLTVLHSLCSTSCTACDSGWKHYDRAWRFTVLRRSKKRSCMIPSLSSSCKGSCCVS